MTLRNRLNRLERHAPRPSVCLDELTCLTAVELAARMTAMSDTELRTLVGPGSDLDAMSDAELSALAAA